MGPELDGIIDYEKVIDALLAHNENSGSTEVALVYMGHGTEHCADATYSEIQAMMHGMGYENAFVGTVESLPGIDETIAQFTAYGAKKVVPAPFMLVAGDHANNDMVGDEEDSWKNIFANAGIDVECVLEGMGQNPAIRALYVSHVQDAIEDEKMRKRIVLQALALALCLCYSIVRMAPWRRSA